MGLTCIPEEIIPIPDFTFPRLSYVIYTNAESDVVKDAISILQFELVDYGLLCGKVEKRRVYRYFVLG